MTVHSSTGDRHLLLLSNSTNPDRGFLDHAEDVLGRFLAGRQRVLFVPFAGVTLSWDAYAAKVRARLAPLGLHVESIHDADDGRRAVEEAAVVMVGGGNTWHLLRELQQRALLAPIAAAVNAGIPYVGWSAGANVACPTIRTTNDMPVVEVESFGALGLVPFQINPHYTDRAIPGHGGETRPERIEEFLVANPGVPVIGLPEGSWLHQDRSRLALGGGPAVLFRSGQPAAPLAPGLLDL
jgi:dipeptidase E